MAAAVEGLVMGDDGLARAACLVPAGLHDRVDGLRLRRVDEAARVHDDHVRFTERRGLLGAVGDELGEIALAVDGVFVAAEGEQADFHGVGRRDGIGPKLAHGCDVGVKAGRR